MPLSEEELRLLEQMERALVEEDPKFASTLRGTSLRRSARRRAVAAGLGLVVGITVLMTGAISNQVVIGVVGFIVMLGSATVGLAALRGQQHAGSDAVPSDISGLSVIQGGKSAKGGKSAAGAGGKVRKNTRRPQARPGEGSFMQRMEQRWRRRRDSNGY